MTIAGWNAPVVIVAAVEVMVLVFRALSCSRPYSVVPTKKSISGQTTNSFVLYGAVFVGGAVATLMLVLAILTPYSRTSGNSRLPLIAAQRANERTVRRSHGLIFSRQSGPMPSEEAPLLCLYDRNTERKREPVRYQLLKHLPARRVDSKSFSDELITEGRREHLAQRSVRWLRTRRLDGMHIQWMYPGEGNGRPSDRENFPKLLAQIGSAFKASALIKCELAFTL
ncbi:hypothetical protein HPB51_016408 [Rhipicephalus microplus]|uniref:Uncharacterized protein n=1 Tax=Rhipicephalus microplus TaxID=6941 RepID=A0A9J6EAJ9_RHIMP|nr:hypothetical protein HPB51_016408 [Rhipicephalus microplus]